MKPGLGKIQPGGAVGSKEAFHCPVVMAYSQQVLSPGQEVRFTDQTLTKVVEADGTKHGIVDPFIEANDIQPGFPFWVLLTPDTTHNLSHKFDVVLPDLPEIAEPAAPNSSLMDLITTWSTATPATTAPPSVIESFSEADLDKDYPDEDECTTMGCNT